MHKNAIKIVWGGLGSQKLCAFYHKCGAFLVGKNCAPFCALFGQKMCAFEFKIIKNSEQVSLFGWLSSGVDMSYLIYIESSENVVISYP